MAGFKPPCKVLGTGTGAYEGFIGMSITTTLALPEGLLLS